MKGLGMVALLLLAGCYEHEWQCERQCDYEARNQAVLVCMYDHYKTQPDDRWASAEHEACEEAAEVRFCKYAQVKP